MNTGSLALDAEALYLELKRGVQALLRPETRLWFSPYTLYAILNTHVSSGPPSL